MRIRFMLIAWAIGITVLALMANSPVHLGPLSRNTVTLGFPFLIATWIDGELARFHLSNLIVNMALWISAAVCVPLLVWLELAVRRKRINHKKGPRADE